MRYDTYMSVVYATVSTKGQVTIPAEIREALHISPGRRVGFRMDGDQVSLEVPTTVEEVRTMLQAAMKANGTQSLPYQNGDGWAVHVKETYGQS